MNVLVIGDVIIDRFTYGRKIGVSAETPTVVAEKTGEEMFVGGAGLVIRNLLRLGAQVYSACPGPSIFVAFNAATDTPTSDEFRRLREALPLDRKSPFAHVQKARFFVDGYKMVQYDMTRTFEHDHHSTVNTIDAIDRLQHPDAVVVADNRHGALNENIASYLVSLCREESIPLYVDSQVSQSESNHHWYRGAHNFVLNSHEFREITGFDAVSGVYRDAKEMFELACGDLLAKLDADRIYVKLGAYGSVCYDPFNGATRMRFSVADKNVKVVDTCGAGDAFLAALVMSGGNQALANQWASRSVGLKGTRVPTLPEKEE